MSEGYADDDAADADPRTRIVDSAFRLLNAGGREAVTTRAVGRMAGVQAPTIYRMFGDKEGLLDAVVVHGFALFRRRNPVPSSPDPVADLRRGWDLHVEFGLTHPYLYSLMFGDARPGRQSPAARDADRFALGHMHRIAEQGRLRIPEERAVALFRAAGSGTTFALIAMPEPQRDISLSVLVRETAVAAVVADAPPRTVSPPVAAAVHLRAALTHSDVLTPHESLLLQDWLTRIVDATP